MPPRRSPPATQASQLLRTKILFFDPSKYLMLRLLSLQDNSIRYRHDKVYLLRLLPGVLPS